MNITGGKFNGRKVVAPDENITRPTLSKVRMGVFNTLFSILGDFGDKSFLDLFGGSGIMGLEAISRGFQSAVVFEKNPKAAQIIRRNYESLGLEPNLKIGDSLRFLTSTDYEYDVIYVDPPYKSGVYGEVLEVLKNKVQNSIIVLEHSEELSVNSLEYSLLKTKNYGGKKVSFYTVNK